MIDGNPLETVVPDDAVQVQLVFHPLELSQGGGAMEGLPDAGGNGAAFGILLTVRRDGVVGPHGSVDAVGLNVARGCEYRDEVDAVVLHHRDARLVVPIHPALPSCRLPPVREPK